MTIHSSNYSSKMVFLIAILIVLIPTGCQYTSFDTLLPQDPGIDTLLPEETPILETIYDFDHKLIAPMHAAGWFEMQPGRRFVLRLRALWPNDIEVKIDNQALAEVKDTAVHPELDSTGYYRVMEVRPIHLNDPHWFWQVAVFLPLDKRGNVDFAMTVHATYKNRPGGAQEVPPLEIRVRRTPSGIPKPSSVFFDAPDAKHTKLGANSAFIADNVTLAGWLFKTPFRNTDDDPETEDWHYDIWLDNEFIERNYDANTMPLATATIPGQWYTQLDDLVHPRKPIPLTSGGQPNASTFLIPGTGLMTVELNAYHPNRHNVCKDVGCVQMPIPSGWVKDADPSFASKVVWPFPVMTPWNYMGSGSSEPPLQEGDYVIITGALVEDSAHLHLADGEKGDAAYQTHKCWFDTYKGHGGWLEIHPVDSIRRIPTKQAPVVRVTPQVFQVCRKDSSITPWREDTLLAPIPPEPPSAYSMLRFREIIDDRFTDMSTIDQHTVELSPYDPTKLHVLVSAKPDGHFKAVYLLWWEEANTPRPTIVPAPTDAPILPEECLRACKNQLDSCIKSVGTEGGPLPKDCVRESGECKASCSP